MRVLFVLYGTFRSNSAGHVAHFASRLVSLGCNVVVVGDGDPGDMAADGTVNYHTITRADCLARPSRLERFFGRRPWHNLVIHGWTPRESVRTTTKALRYLAPGPTVIHLEDNEDAIIEAYLGRKIEALRNESTKTLDRIVPKALTHPLRGQKFVDAADGVTAIVDTLLRGRPQSSRSMVLAPGVDVPLPVSDSKKAEIRTALGLKLDDHMIVYPGNMHMANRSEVFELYRAIELLNQRGARTVLVRCGENHCKPIDDRFDRIRATHSIDLGFVPRPYLLDLLGSASVLVQPGAPSLFNDYRLPSKLPEFLASGRPVVLPRANIGLELTDGINAVLLDHGDADDITEKTMDLLNNPLRASAIGSAGRKFAATMSWDQGTRELLRFYSLLIASIL
jgi:glycosyltransferase involved in cell wall biosynthesis